jgi:hypothetical protein
MTSTYKGPTAYKTLDEYLEANISDEMREHLKKIDAYRKEHAPAYMPENNLEDAAPTYYHYSMPGKRLNRDEWGHLLKPKPG